MVAIGARGALVALWLLAAAAGCADEAIEPEEVIAQPEPEPGPVAPEPQLPAAPPPVPDDVSIKESQDVVGQFQRNWSWRVDPLAESFQILLTVSGHDPSPLRAGDFYFEVRREGEKIQSGSAGVQLATESDAKVLLNLTKTPPGFADRGAWDLVANGGVTALGGAMGCVCHYDLSVSVVYPRTA